MKLLTVMLLIAMPVFSAMLETPDPSNPPYGQKFQTFCFCATSLTATMQMFGYNDDSSGSETKGFVTANICASGAELIASEPSEGKSNKPVILTFPSPVFNYDYKAFCYWSENCELEIDKPDCANIFKMNFFNSGGTPKAIIDSDQFIVKGLKPGRYCIELEADEKINMGGIFRCKKTDIKAQSDTVVNMLAEDSQYTDIMLSAEECINRDGSTLDKYVSRLYFDWYEGNEPCNVNVTMIPEKQEQLANIFQEYTITLKRTRPIVHIHDICDGPLKEPQEGEELYPSKSMKQIQDTLPYFVDMYPCQLVEFPWDFTNRSYEYYAMENGILEEFIKERYENWPLDPIYYCNGVGGLLLLRLLKNSEAFRENIGGIIFVATPFFGCELAHFYVNNQNMTDGVLDDLAETCGILDYESFKSTSLLTLRDLCLRCEESWSRKSRYNDLMEILKSNKVHVYYADYGAGLLSLFQGGLGSVENKTSYFIPNMLMVSGAGLCLAAAALAGLPAWVGIAGAALTFSGGAFTAWNYNSDEVERIKVEDKDGLLRELCMKGDGMVSVCSARLYHGMGNTKAENELTGISHGTVITLTDTISKTSPLNHILDSLAELSKPKE